MVYFAACVYEGGSFTPPNRDLKKMYVANFSFVKLRDDRETSIFGNTRHVSMQYKGKSFTVEGFKASKYTLFSLKKKNHLCSSAVIRVLASVFCSKRIDSALSQPSECFTRVVTSLCAVCSEEDHDTWTICQHLEPTWVVGLPLYVKWKIYSLVKSFIWLSAIQPVRISSKCLPSAFYLSQEGFQGRWIFLFNYFTHRDTLLFRLYSAQSSFQVQVEHLLSGVSRIWLVSTHPTMFNRSWHPAHTPSIRRWLPGDGVPTNCREGSSSKPRPQAWCHKSWWMVWSSRRETAPQNL